MAPTGQAETHSAWPLQSPWSTVASLSLSTMAPGSGQAAAQVPQPTHMSARTVACGRIPPEAPSAAATGALTTSKICWGTPQPGQKVDAAGTA